ncbi:MAG: metallophosphoesterase [Candidatus Edwardsbacteria bacterium]|nr:metallophosphoesterase [Candidatus Edwardsbacteria bacterium]
MKTIIFAVFISIAILVYGAVNYYVFIRGWQALPKQQTLRLVYAALFILIAGSFVAGRFAERAEVSWFSNPLVWVGSFWLAFMLYLTLSLIALDLLRLSNALFHYWPQAILGRYQTAKLIAFGVILGGTAVAVIAGHINALKPQIKMLELSVPKTAKNLKSLNIVMASDIHLGAINGSGRLAKLADMVNAQEPDIILLAGDIVDEDIGRVIKDNLGETLKKLKAPLRVYGVTGNHEYIGGAAAAVDYLNAHGVTMLRDSAVLIDNSFYVAGRDDRSGQRFNGRLRRSLPELLAGVDRTKPLILMDHQPLELEAVAAQGVDLQFSGHTHHGQLWPFNYVTQKVYQISRGYEKIGDTHFYVSSGYGTWGPPVRIGSRPEIVKIVLRFLN